VLREVREHHRELHGGSEATAPHGTGQSVVRCLVRCLVAACVLSVVRCLVRCLVTLILCILHTQDDVLG